MGAQKKKNPNAEARRKTQTHTFSICLDRNYLYLRFEFCVFLFFSFFGTRFGRQISLLRLLFMNSSCTIWLFSHISAHQWVPCTIHGTHKSHFLTTFFLLKMDSTVPFTHLKLFCYSIFSLQFSIKIIFNSYNNKIFPRRPWKSQGQLSCMGFQLKTKSSQFSCQAFSQLHVTSKLYCLYSIVHHLNFILH